MRKICNELRKEWFKSFIISKRTLNNSSDCKLRWIIQIYGNAGEAVASLNWISVLTKLNVTQHVGMSVMSPRPYSFVQKSDHNKNHFGVVHALSEVAWERENFSRDNSGGTYDERNKKTNILSPSHKRCVQKWQLTNDVEKKSQF